MLPSILSDSPAKYSSVHAPYLISLSASRNVLPLFEDSSAAKLLALAYVAAAIFCRILPLCAGSIAAQSLDSNATLDAETHLSTSPIVALGVVAITSPVAGFNISAVAPSSASHQSPAIIICSLVMT